MEIRLMKQPQKYLDSVGVKTRKMLYKTMEQLKTLDGDIVKLKGYDNLYRRQIEHYRILFSINRGGNDIIVRTTNAETDIK